MKIGIDCRLAGSKHAGIGRYTENLILNLLEKDLKTIWILFFYNQNQAKEVLKKNYSNKNVKVIISPISHYSIEEQIKLPKIFKSAKLDLLHVPHFNIPIFYKGKLVVTIHDLLWHEYKGGTVTTLSPIKYFLKYFFYKLVTKLAVIKAQKILVPAETIKNTLIKFYPNTKDKIVVTKEGAKIWNKKKTKNNQKIINEAENATSKQTTNKLKKTILYVGSLYPHKNIKLVLRSLKRLKNYKLLIVGSRNIFRNQTQNFVKNILVDDQVEFLGFVSDQELATLYSNVTALVQPSFSEGFGLTGVEAMSMNTPILASDIPIFKEIYQDVAYYFSPHSESSFISAVHELENDDLTRLKKGLKLAKTYSWNKMALETLTVYNSVLK